MKDVKISDYLWFQEGPGVRNTQYTTSGVKLINVANLVDGNVDLSTSDRYISEEEAYGKYNHFLADDGDFVIASSGIKIDYFDKKMGFIKKEHLPLCMNTSCIRFKVLDTNNLEIKYFMYYLKSNSFKKQLFNQITGSAQLNFGPSHLKKMTFPLIELKEQKRIIERLDKTQNIINETKSLLSKYDTLIKSRFIEMFGEPATNPKKWEIKTLDEVCKKITDGKHGGCKLEDNSDYYYVGAREIFDLNIHYETAQEITKEDFEKDYKRCNLEIGDFCIVNTGATIGKTAIAKDVRTTKTLLQKSVALLKTKENLLSALYLQYSYITNPSMYKVENASAQPNLLLSKIRETKIMLPPLFLQNNFATFVQQIDKSKFEYTYTGVAA